MSELVLALLLSAAPPAISFDDAVKRALEHHPAMRLAEQDAARAMALVEQARAPSLPTLVANGSYSRLDDDRLRNGIVLANKDQLSANLQLAVPLVNTPRWATWYRAAQAADAAKATAADVKRQVALGAAHT